MQDATIKSLQQQQHQLQKQINHQQEQYRHQQAFFHQPEQYPSQEQQTLSRRQNYIDSSDEEIQRKREEIGNNRKDGEEAIVTLPYNDFKVQSRKKASPKESKFKSNDLSIQNNSSRVMLDSPRDNSFELRYYPSSFILPRSFFILMNKFRF